MTHLQLFSVMSTFKTNHSKNRCLLSTGILQIKGNCITHSLFWCKMHNFQDTYILSSLFCSFSSLFSKSRWMLCNSERERKTRLGSSIPFRLSMKRDYTNSKWNISVNKNHTGYSWKAAPCSCSLHSTHLLQVFGASIILKVAEVYILYSCPDEDTEISQTTKYPLLMNMVVATELAMEEVCNLNTQVLY